MLKLAEPKPRTEKQTHEPSGVTVDFKRVGHTARTKLMGACRTPAGGMDIGALIMAAAEPGVGVHSWSGVEGPGGEAIPYSLKTLDWVVENVPTFGGWFNDHLLRMCGLAKDEADGGDSGGNLSVPADGAGAGSQDGLTSNK